MKNGEIAGEQETVPPASEMTEHEVAAAFPEIVGSNRSESPVFLDTDQPIASPNVRVADADTPSFEQQKMRAAETIF